MTDAIPAAVLSKLWENRDYYAAIGATVRVLGDANGKTIGVDDVEAVRYDSYGKPSEDEGRRYLWLEDTKIVVDKKSSNGVPLETKPYFDVPHEKPDMVRTAELIVHD